MKVQKTIYGSATAIFCLWMLKNAYTYLEVKEAKQLCMHFGLPNYIRVELAIAKIIGVAVLGLPIVKDWLKEWAYAGFVITLISGFIAHLASGDGITSSLPALAALAILLTSYINYRSSNTSANKQLFHS